MLSGFSLNEGISKVTNKDQEPSPISLLSRLSTFVSLVTHFTLLAVCFHSAI